MVLMRFPVLDRGNAVPGFEFAVKILRITVADLLGNYRDRQPRIGNQQLGGLLQPQLRYIFGERGFGDFTE